ncbi:MAG: hypothetical protein AAF558_13985 [Verrucomicrobiota bacterium]
MRLLESLTDFRVKLTVFVGIVFLVMVCLSTIPNSEFLFQKDPLENGDFASNAFRIEKASAWQETRGNYSRWNFNHPGPAFFYCYALGEKVFYDLLGLSKSEHAAHVLAGIILQAACFAAAIFVIVCATRSLCLGLVSVCVGIIHFGLTEVAMTSIWPPHQLLMPFLLWMLTSIGFSCGRLAFLPFVILSGAFCVHGHIAQPLFIVPVTLIAMVGFFWSRRKCDRLDPRTQESGIVGLSAVILILSLLPVVLHFFFDPYQNMSRVLQHLGASGQEGYSWGASMGYNLSFLSYWALGEPSSGMRKLLIEKGYLVLPLTFLVFVPIFLSIIPGSLVKKLPESLRVSFLKYRERRFFLHSGYCLLLIYLLCFFWGASIEGGMYSFNSFFIYAPIFLSLILCVGFAAIFLSHRGRKILTLIVVVSSIGFTSTKGFSSSIRSNNGTKKQDVEKLVAEIELRVGSGGLTVFLNESSWVSPISVLLELHRRGVDLNVSPHTALATIMGDDFTSVGRVRNEYSSRNFLIVSPRKVDEKSESILESSYEIHHGFVGIGVAKFPRQIQVGDLEFWMGSEGFSQTRGNQTDSLAEEARLMLLPKVRADESVVVRLQCCPFFVKGINEETGMKIRIGEIGRECVILPDGHEIICVIPAAKWNECFENETALNIDFRFENPFVPADVGLGRDRRQLALQLSGIIVEKGYRVAEGEERSLVLRF